MYYVIETNYVGPNQDQNPDADHIDITTTPATKNMSGEECLDGWCGTTNDLAVYAHGAYETLDEARQAVTERFGQCREDEDLEQYAQYEGVVARFRLGQYRPMSVSEAGDWMYAGMELDIDADTSDERLEELINEYENDANDEGITLLGACALDILREYRQQLRKKLAEKLADECIVITDGQLRYPVLKSNLRPGDTEDVIRVMGEREYSDWCRAVPAVTLAGAVGSDGCAELCEELFMNGSKLWTVG